MRKTMLKVAVPLSILILAVFAVFMVNQTAQLVGLAGQIHPIFADAVLWTVILLLGTCIVVPVILIARLPKRITPPSSS